MFTIPHPDTRAKALHPGSTERQAALPRRSNKVSTGSVDVEITCCGVSSVGLRVSIQPVFEDPSGEGKFPTLPIEK